MSRPNLGPRLHRNAAGYWEIRWSVEGRSHTKSLQTKLQTDAEQAFARWLSDRHRATKRNDYTVREAYELRLKEHVAKRVIDQERLTYCWKQLLPIFGSLPASGIPPATITGYEDRRRAAGVAEGTVRKELGELAAALNYLVKTRRVASDEISAIPLPPKPAARERFLTAEEIDRLLETAAKRREGPRLSRIERYIWIMLETGSRPTPPRELTWPRVDFQAKLIDPNVPGRRRTKKKRSVVRISDTLLPVLRRAHQERTGDLVLDHSGSLRTSFESLMRAAKLDDVTPYTLRHTWASHAVMNGANLWLVAKVLGNTVAMVESTYGHLQPEFMDSVINLRPVRLRAAV